MNYCKVANGQRVDGPRAFSGKTHEEILREGWLPHRLVEQNIPDSVFLGSTWEVTSTEVVETQQFRPMTEEEKETRRRAEENLLNQLQLENIELKQQVTQLQFIISSLSGSN